MQLALEQVEQSFPPKFCDNPFRAIIHRILELLADIVEFFCGESYSDRIREYNKPEQQKIYEKVELRFTLFGREELSHDGMTYEIGQELRQLNRPT